MSDIAPDDMDQYREIMRSLNLPDAERDEMIRIVDNIVTSFIDQAFGISPVQLSLSARANFNFLGIGRRAIDEPVIEKEFSRPMAEDSHHDANPESPQHDWKA